MVEWFEGDGSCPKAIRTASSGLPRFWSGRLGGLSWIYSYQLMEWRRLFTRYSKGAPGDRRVPGVPRPPGRVEEVLAGRAVKKVERIGIVQNFSEITEFALTTDIVEKIMRGWRARWRIENKTFNTMKNQGYHFEHNYGHGKKNLSVVLAMVMMVAFLVDQTQQLCCPWFQAAWATRGNNRADFL